MINSTYIARKNSYLLSRYEDAAKAIQNFDTDKYQNRRLSLNECKACYYLTSYGSLQAFTEYQCMECKELKVHHNSRTPTFCKDCCEEHTVCCRCGANLNFG